MAKLEDLKPKQHFRVYDLVEAAGLDVRDWAASATDPTNPQTNAKYRSNWSFVDPGNAVVLFLWYDELEEKDDKIYQAFNLNDWLANFEANPRRHLRLSRARAFRDAVRIAYQQHLLVRVIFIEGSKEDISDPEAESSKIALRYLDSEPWYVESYDDTTGDCVITRGQQSGAHPLYVDQFSLHDDTQSSDPERRKAITRSFKRSGAVRSSALGRAAGHCEFCNEPGFRMPDGRLYLETHHIIPLSQGGLDQPRNVVALCGNHHREAHLGERRDEIAHNLSVLISTFYSR
ncbi:HNH endonuclease [Parvibaculum sp.]|uniref:HNH endonuclease n=1 Tax=Parvibaculum sp. TaxID=2024848 RepID=UPI001D893B3B|nr:HNH endonuclease [Parvibaculum sp.]MBX3490609.1 HNH endonuclease [Parvibaculum sp.]MCW5728468.1 HNH endonuclease [Parvibaculum sp.]